MGTVYIEVDGKAVDADCYTAESGSTVITLKAGYLETLAAGEHTLTVLYTNGEAVGTFVIAEKPAEPAKPAGPVADDGDEDVVAQTGDSADIAPWIALILISVVSMTAAVVIRRKRG